MSFSKLAYSQRVLRTLAVKQAGAKLLLGTGAALAGGAHLIGSGLKKGRDYRAGFNPGMYQQQLQVPQGSHE